MNQPPTKWQVYEQILRVPYYVLFDRYQNQFRVFEMVGTRYQELQLTEQRLWFEELKLGLGIWSGSYQGADGLWLRWWTEGGDWVLMAAERATQAEALVEQERQRAERLTAQLRALGIEPDRSS